MSVEDLTISTGKPLQSIADVAAELEYLEDRLAGCRIEYLRNFNRTYLIITRKVQAELQAGHFEHPEFIEQFDTRFAAYYFHALTAYFAHDSVPLAWKIAIDYGKQRDPSGFLAMALGVNAHIRNDIPQVLRDCKAARQHYRDYTHINTIIDTSISEVTACLLSSKRFLNPNRKSMSLIFTIAMRSMTRYWRFQSWRDYRRYTARSITKQKIESAATTSALLLSKLPM